MAAVAVILVVSMLPEWVGAATVSGTDAVNIRSCPSLECDIVATAPLGTLLDVTGTPENGFTPVTWQGVRGFAYHLFVSEDDEPPWLLQGDPACNHVALIFNIGIGSAPSQVILETLMDHSTPATMFAMGWWALEHPDYLRRLNGAGFVIGTHGDQPRLLTEAAAESIVQDLESSIATIEAVIGRPIDPWSTPYAAATDPRVRSIVAGLGIMPVGWTVTANDYGASANTAEVYERIMKGVHPGAIVELHLDGPATEQSTAIVLPTIIDELRTQGYRFVTVPELAAPCSLPSTTEPAEPVDQIPMGLM